MRRIIRSRDGRPCHQRLLRTPLPVRRTLVWQQDRWPVQLIPSTLWLGLASNPSARACDHVQRWPQPLSSNYSIYLQIGTSLARRAWTKLMGRAPKESAAILSRSCPLWVKSGHGRMSDRCPLYPQKRTSVERVGMSALCQKRT